MMKHTVAVLVENHFGVLARVAGLFSARGFNIDSLAVGETHDPTISRMTIVVHGDERILDQIVKQLSKLIDVIRVESLKDEIIDRELLLAKVVNDAASRNDVMQIVNTFRAKIVDVNPETLTIEVTGGESKIDAMLELLAPIGIRETARTGLIALSRRAEITAPANEKVEAAKKINASGKKKVKAAAK